MLRLVGASEAIMQSSTITNLLEVFLQQPNIEASPAWEFIHGQYKYPVHFNGLTLLNNEITAILALVSGVMGVNHDSPMNKFIV